jgi:AcrR family transcriptional regulator
MPAPDASTTRHQLIQAAGRLFAEHGFDGTSTRAISEASGANLAAIHYHFGSKKALYLAVLTTVCDQHQEAFRASDDLTTPRDAPTDLAATIRLRVRLLFEILTGPRAIPWQAQLIVREMTQPSSAHSVIVDLLAAPLHARWVAIHRQVRPHANPTEAHVWALHLPAMLRLLMTARPTMERIIGVERCDASLTAEAIRQTADAMILLLGVSLPIETTP